MERILLLYNSTAGDASFNNKLDGFIKVFNSLGYAVEIFRSPGLGKMTEYLNNRDLSDVKAIFVAGGDGTFNEVVNAIMRSEIKPPLGVIPIGTGNDFAKAVGLNLPIEEVYKAIAKLQMQTVDVGEANGQYFINVCGAGLFTNVSQNTNADLKHIFGRLPYYTTGITQLKSFKPFHLTIEADGKTYTDEFLLFVVMNSDSAAGIRMAPGTDLADGQFDFVGIKKAALPVLATVLVKLMKKKHLKDKHVLHLKSDYYKISSDDISESLKEADIDGESGPQLPLEIKVHKNALTVITNF
ncbi:MAG: YegS/Rv2252/BmrU family lipid kinase [Clostridiales bacterium]|nr:YegS/Rv2252/BmrU family lipid kinase [Clostridiales bacterium]